MTFTASVGGSTIRVGVPLRAVRQRLDHLGGR